MARTASGSAIDKERWQVRLSPGCTVEMTVDQLDVAFDAGTVGAKTEVCPPGSLRFTTLGEAAGLEDVPHESPHSVAPFAADVGPPSGQLLGAGEALSVAAAGPSPAPARRTGRAGSVIAIMLMFLVLIAIGMGGGAYAARPVEMRAKVAALRAKITAAPRAVVVAAPPSLSPSPPPIAPPPASPPPPPLAAVSAAPSPATTTVDRLPNASDKGVKVKGKATSPAKSKPRK